MSNENHTSDDMSLPVDNQLELYNTQLSKGNKMEILILGGFLKCM